MSSLLLLLEIMVLKEVIMGSGTVAYSYNLICLGGFAIQDQSGQKVSDALSQPTSQAW
jgi:hypothetical protein